MKTATQWTHKVVKQSRDGQGQWFSHKTAFTGSLEECEKYAESFLADQLVHLRGSMGHRITIKQRGGKVTEKIYRYDV